jgi:hypothetical protein
MIGKLKHAISGMTEETAGKLMVSLQELKEEFIKSKKSAV